MFPPHQGSRAGRFLRDARGASAVEFAIVTLPFIALVLAVLEMATTFYFSASLDQATHNVAQQIRNGTIQLSETSQADMRTKYLCPLLPRAMTCSKIQVGMQANADCATTSGNSAGCWSSYYSNWTQAARNKPALDSSSYSTGVANNSLYMTVVYPMPLVFTYWSTIASAKINGVPVRAIVSTEIFINDPAAQH
ncbi:MAG: TadE/TadG family type IV pilus assembly protein [Rhodoblastus sp.]